MSLWRDGVEVELDGPKQRTVLAALLLADNQVLSDFRLSELLWGDYPPATANAQIYTYMSRLRKRLGDLVEIVRCRPGYLLRSGEMLFDYRDFAKLAHDGHNALGTGAFDLAVKLLNEALALWRGSALLGVTEYLADAETAWMEEKRMAVVQDRIDAELGLGRHERLVPELTKLVADNPFRESLRVQLMVALFRCGRQSDAFTVFQEGSRMLDEQLGVEPGTALRDAYCAMLTGAAEFDSISG